MISPNPILNKTMTISSIQVNVRVARSLGWSNSKRQLLNLNVVVCSMIGYNYFCASVVHDKEQLPMFEMTVGHH